MLQDFSIFLINSEKRLCKAKKTALNPAPLELSYEVGIDLGFGFGEVYSRRLSRFNAF